MKRISEDIQKIMVNIENNINELESCPSPYRKVKISSTWRSKVKKFIPKFALTIRENAKMAKADMDFIR